MNISLDTKNAITELVEKAKLKKGDLVVVGCSSSEILGECIGKGSSPETGFEVATTVLSISPIAVAVLPSLCGLPLMINTFIALLLCYDDAVYAPDC